MKLSGKHGNLALGGVSIVTGIIILVLTKIQGLGFLKNGMPGAGMFPTLCAIAVAVCGGLLILEVLGSERKAKREGKHDPELQENLININELRNLLIFMVLGGLILVLSDYIGLLTCLCLSIIVYIKIQGKDPWWKAIAIGIGVTIFLYLVFAVFLRVPLPKGPFGF